MSNEMLERKLREAETDLASEYTRRRKLQHEVERLKNEIAQITLARDSIEATKNDLISLATDALTLWENCGAEEYDSPKYGKVYTVDPTSFDGISEVLERAINR